jgi:predicted O-methyltransferase YrrM
MFPYSIDSAGTFHVGEIEFHIDMSPKNRRRSKPGSFTIVKNLPYLSIYSALSKTIKPRTILELGIYQGGSYVLLDKLFKPDRISALDISAEPVEALLAYCDSLPHRSVHFQTSQVDEPKLSTIINDDLGGVVDLVVDDASHSYELTRRSFEILFPRLASGGVYIIEDWGWSHLPAYQSSGAPWHDKPALTNFIFELIALQGSSSYITEVRVMKPLVVVRKAPIKLGIPGDFMNSMMLRGRTFVVGL